MAQGQRRIRPEFWIILIFVALVLYALIADWWKGHATLGWVIFGIVVAVLAFCLYKKQAFREWALRTIRDSLGGLIHEPAEPRTGSGRAHLPQWKIDYIRRRAEYRCENPNCRTGVKPDIHHIDLNNSHNRLSNLIALCPSCHREAGDGRYSRSEIRDWARRSEQTSRKRRRRF